MARKIINNNINRWYDFLGRRKKKSVIENKCTPDRFGVVSWDYSQTPTNGIHKKQGTDGLTLQHTYPSLYTPSAGRVYVVAVCKGGDMG